MCKEPASSTFLDFDMDQVDIGIPRVWIFPGGVGGFWGNVGGGMIWEPSFRRMCLTVCTP